MYAKPPNAGSAAAGPAGSLVTARHFPIFDVLGSLSVV